MFMIGNKITISQDLIRDIVTGIISFLLLIVIMNSCIDLDLTQKKTSTERKGKIQETQTMQEKTEEIESGKTDPTEITKDGIRKKFHKNRRLLTETPYKDGKREGLSKSYFIDGALSQEMNWKEDKPDGIQKLYYRSGKIKQEAFFKNGQRDGVEKTYYEDGNLMMEEKYAQGERLYTKRFDKKGHLIYEQAYGAKEGLPPNQ